MHTLYPGHVGRTLVTSLLAAALVSCASVPSESADQVLQRANTAMGGSDLRSIQFSGTGSGATFGQAFRPGEAWPRITYTQFSRVADYANAALREDAARSRAEPTGGGAVPLMGTGEQRTSGWLRGASAWNVAGGNTNPAPLVVSGRMHDLWTTPHGVIKAALAHPSTVRQVKDGDRSLTAVSFAVPGRFTATARINAQGLVEQIDSMQPNPVMGDTASTIRFSDYRLIDGVQFPMRIRQDMGGYPVLDLTVSEVKPNVAPGIEVPASVVSASERVATEKAADGVWFLAGGSHNSVAIEMRDHMMVVESPLYDGRAEPMLAEVRRLANGKPIRYVVNSHHHFDHSGGLRTAVAEGATLVTSQQARPFFEKVLANPNRIAPDAMEKSGRKASVIGVDGKRVFSDGVRTVEVHDIKDGVHANGFLMVYLPREKILIEADAFTPGPPNAAPPAQPNGNNVNLVENLDRLQMQVDTILPLHGRIVKLADLYNAVGRKP